MTLATRARPRGTCRHTDQGGGQGYEPEAGRGPARADQLGRVTPHSLRRTYASLRAALRDDPVYIAEQLGHEDARFTFRVYQRAAKRRERLLGAHLAAFDLAREWAAVGREPSSDDIPDQASEEADAAGNRSSKVKSGPSGG